MERAPEFTKVGLVTGLVTAGNGLVIYLLQSFAAPVWLFKLSVFSTGGLIVAGTVATAYKGYGWFTRPH